VEEGREGGRKEGGGVGRKEGRCGEEGREVWGGRKGGVGRKERRKEGRKVGRKEGRKERRNEGTKERRNEGTKEAHLAFLEWQGRKEETLRKVQEGRRRGRVRKEGRKVGIEGGRNIYL
jgi:hypothetical protein